MTYLVQYFLAMPIISAVNNALKVLKFSNIFFDFSIVFTVEILNTVTAVNTFLKKFLLQFQFGLSELKLRFRERLTRHLYGKYLE